MRWRHAPRASAIGPIAVYLSTPPSLFAPTAQGLAEAGLVAGNTRIAMEKPIGQDLASSKQVNDAIGALFPKTRFSASTIISARKPYRT